MAFKCSLAILLLAIVAIGCDARARAEPSNKDEQTSPAAPDEGDVEEKAENEQETDNKAKTHPDNVNEIKKDAHRRLKRSTRATAPSNVEYESVVRVKRGDGDTLTDSLLANDEDKARVKRDADTPIDISEDEENGGVCDKANTPKPASGGRHKRAIPKMTEDSERRSKRSVETSESATQTDETDENENQLEEAQDNLSETTDEDELKKVTVTVKTLDEDTVSETNAQKNSAEENDAVGRVSEEAENGEENIQNADETFDINGAENVENHEETSANSANTGNNDGIQTESGGAEKSATDEIDNSFVEKPDSGKKSEKTESKPEDGEKKYEPIVYENKTEDGHSKTENTANNEPAAIPINEESDKNTKSTSPETENKATALSSSDAKVSGNETISVDKAEKKESDKEDGKKIDGNGEAKKEDVKPTITVNSKETENKAKEESAKEDEKTKPTKFSITYFLPWMGGEPQPKPPQENIGGRNIGGQNIGGQGSVFSRLLGLLRKPTPNTCDAKKHYEDVSCSCGSPAPGPVAPTADSHQRPLQTIILSKPTTPSFISSPTLHLQPNFTSTSPLTFRSQPDASDDENFTVDSGNKFVPLSKPTVNTSITITKFDDGFSKGITKETTTVYVQNHPKSLQKSTAAAADEGEHAGPFGRLLFNSSGLFGGVTRRLMGF